MTKFLGLLILLWRIPAFAQLTEPTPPMGWNSWNLGYQTYGCCTTGGFVAGPWQPTETLMKQQADALVSTGLYALGYNLVEMDAGGTSRSGSALVEYPGNFPSGMPALASYIHAKGMRYGMYGSPGSVDCVRASGQFGHETTDMATIAGWGVDFWKDDSCYMDSDYPNTSVGMQSGYQAINNAIVAAGRTVSHNVNSPTHSDWSVTWFQTIGATSVRIGNDNNNTNVDDKSYNTDWASYRPYQNKGHWLDPDILLAQMKENGADGPGLGTALTDVEGRTQFSHYAILAAPLIIAADLTTLSAYTLATFSNAEVIAVDQDSLGTMGYRVSRSACGATYCEVWARHLHNGWAVELVNRDTVAAHDITVNWSMFGVAGNNYNIRDLWAHSSVGTSTSGYTATGVGQFVAVMLLLTPANGGIITANINGGVAIQ